jgi:DNA-binding NtrC family response regulator
VPPLRARREEIPHLSSFFLREACDELAKPDVEISPAALDLFAQYLWPGNVRQLRNEIRRAVAMSVPGTVITPDLLSPDLANLDRESMPGSDGPARRTGRPVALATAVEGLERDMIRQALDHAQGNISETARQLGLTRRGLYLKLRRLGLDAPVEMDTK